MGWRPSLKRLKGPKLPCFKVILKSTCLCHIYGINIIYLFIFSPLLWSILFFKKLNKFHQKLFKCFYFCTEFYPLTSYLCFLLCCLLLLYHFFSLTPTRSYPLVIKSGKSTFTRVYKIQKKFLLHKVLLENILESMPWFYRSNLLLFQITTEEDYTWRWLRMGEFQEVTVRQPTVGFTL